MKTRPAYFSPCRRVAASPRHAPQRRGTVLVLVVAVLALLAVIGTAYILASRADKANSSAMNVSQDFDFARKAVMSQTIQTIANGPIGADGNIGSYAIAGSYGSQAARLYEFPDAGEPWLATHLHPQAGDLNLYSAMGPAATPNNAFNPATGGYLAAQPIPYGTAPYNTSLSGTVVGDQTVGDATTDDPPTARADSLMYLLPFSDASGIRYRYWERIIDTSRMANLNTGATDDPSATGDAAGSWFSVIRLAPASGAMPANAVYFNNSDTPAYLQATLPNGSGLGRAGTSASNAVYSGQNWQQQVLRYEKPTDAYLAFFDLSDELDLRAYGEFGTPYHNRPASTSTSGTNYVLWPNTLSVDPSSPGGISGNVRGNPRRRSFTTDSWSRQLRPYPDPGNKYTITPADSLGTPAGYAAANMFPARPAPVSANPLTTTSSPNDLMFYTAMAASNIATIMDYSSGNAIANHGGDPAPYTQEETCAFVANYCTAKWNGFMPDPSIPGQNKYFLPAGPSFVDGNGICIRTADSSGAKLHREFGGGNDIHSEAATKIYLGWSAQPVISEVVANEINDDTGDGQDPAVPPHTVVKATAVELYNPYGVALSLNGYHLEDGGSINIDLTGRYVPANGYLVITTDTTFDGTGNNGTPIPPPPNVQKLVDSSLQANPTGGAFTLYRPYYNRSFTPALAPVDHINYAVLTDVNGVPALPSQKNGDQPKNFSIARPGGPSSSPWSPTLNTPIAARTLTPTLGADNGGGGTNYPLPDRYAMYAAGIPAGQQGNPFGMGEFARIMRITNEFDGSNTTGVILTTGGSNGGLVVDHLTQLPTTATSTAPYSTMDNAAMASMRVEAQILFDFLPSPMACANTPPSDPLGQPGQGDIRAVQLLQQIAMVDRVSEFGIDIGAGATDINKLRIPGQINVNTASGDVLRAIPNMTNQMVANILAYRKRTGAGDPTCTYNGKTNPDFSNTTTYPGRGIRSLAELLIPLQATTATNLANGKAASIDARDALWGAIANYCTVRSDTFVVYGYLEALKAHPLYPAHNNASDWYGNVTDDPRASGYPNLRVARRRWVAIIDRSWCNENKLDSKGNPNAKYSLPRVVAIKDLPQ